MLEKKYLKELIKISFPLIISSSIWTVQHFVDRMFISWYSVKSLAAVLPASFLNLTTTSIFIGTTAFVSTFVSQYYGAKTYEKIGKIVWQGIYFGIIGGIFHIFLFYLSPYIFEIFKHESEVLNYEVTYFQILCLGSFPVIASNSLSSFFSGRGRTVPILIISIIQTILNLVFDYLLIFGKWIFPEMGIKGAGIATVLSQYISLFIYFLLFFLNKKNEIYGVKDFKFDSYLFKNLIRFGVPNGIFFFIDISVWSIFLLIIGKMGVISLSSTNIAFNINTVAFMPMLGIGTGVSVLVGQYIGKGKQEISEKITYMGFLITFIYMVLVALSYVIFPDFYINFFKPKIFPENFLEMRNLTRVLLKFVAFYSVFDTCNVIFISALKGAGDTKFIMKVFLFNSIFIFLLPLYLLTFFFSSNIFIAWILASVYVIFDGLIFFFRFFKGKWKQIKIIEVLQYPMI
ncbi:MAG: MATE family efflux transporter [Candidatus Omnitrophica bacterium]|nr:MATE family efflux transporter [Candidatus Omnitrophota bacterium]MCM8807292.1 MATE family efflux transporter [Candidatus Omnitrophota bacterium]